MDTFPHNFVYPNPVTRDWVANVIYHGLKAQGRFAIVPDGGACRYRITIKGQICRCAAGQIIPEDRYYQNLENSIWTEKHRRAFPELESAWHLIRAAQGMHDAAARMALHQRSLDQKAEFEKFLTNLRSVLEEIHEVTIYSDGWVP